MKSLWIAAVIAAMLELHSTSARAADAPVIQFDPGSKAFSSLLPYRAPFILSIPTPKSATSVGIWFWETTGAAASCSAARPRDALHLSGIAQIATADATEKNFQVTLPALHAGAGYCVSIETAVPWSDAQSTAVVTAATSAVVKLSTKGSVTEQAFLDEVTSALGATADQGVQNHPGETVKSVLAIALSVGKNKIKPLADMEREATDYESQRVNLAAYVGVVQKLKDAMTTAGSPLQTAITATMAQVQAAKLGAPADATGPAVPPPAVKSSIVTLAGLLSKEDCTKIGPAKAKTECESIQNIANNNKDILDGGVDFAAALETDAGGFSAAKQALGSAISTLVSSLVVTATIAATAENPSYTEAAPLYISGDVGVAVPLIVNLKHSYGADLDLYVAVSVSFVSIDKDVPLSKEDSFGRRFSLVGGFTLTAIKSSDGSVTGALGGVGILGGAGLRLTDYIRVGGGVVFLRQNDTDKLISDTHLKVAPYFSLSVDLDVAGVVTGLFSKGAGLHI